MPSLLTRRAMQFAVVACISTLLACSSDLPTAQDSVTGPLPPASVPPVEPAPIVAGDPALPSIFDASVATTPSSGRTLRVSAGGNLQRALDSAMYGDQLLLAAGATFTGNFVLPAKAGGLAGQWITVRTDGVLPAEGTRMTPTLATTLPKIVSASVLPALRTAPAAARWRFVGIEVTTETIVTVNQGLIFLGDGGGAQNTVTSVPTDLVFDRVYVHGHPKLDVRRCFALNSGKTALIDSYVSECHSSFDAQAIGGWNGPGPYKIVNNYLEAAAEVIAFGGGDPSIPNLVPSDIEIRRNHLTKPMSWKGVWLAKNLLELKVGRRVLIEGNVMENSYLDGQAGFAFVLWSVNQQGTCTWCVTEDVTIRYNVIRNVAAGFQLTDKNDATSSPPMRRLAIRDNLLIGVDNPDLRGNGRLFQIGNIIPNLTIEHNTAFSPTNSSLIWAGQAPLPSHVVRNNLIGGGQYQIFTPSGQGQLGWTHVAGAGSAFSGNVVALADPATSPTGNYYPASMDAIGLAGGGAAAYSVTASPTDFVLTVNSPLKGKGTDGRDPGANIAALVAAIQGVVQP